MKSKFIFLLLTALTLASCGTQKASVSDKSIGKTTHSDPALAFIQGVIDNNPTVENIVGNASITLAASGESIHLSGALRMKRDKVIRIQLMMPVIGTELGRLEFTPDYVLILDRVNKQYLKVDYSDVDFLQKNDITFYTLQSLFWNELVTPDGSPAAADAEDYSANLDSDSNYVPITLSQGNTKFQWQANRTDNTISSAIVTHNSSSYGTSTVTWLYSDFTLLDKKKFPKSQEFTFTTMLYGASRRAEVTIDMSEIKTSADWEAETEISSKYRQVSAQTILSRLMSL